MTPTSGPGCDPNRPYRRHPGNEALLLTHRAGPEHDKWNVLCTASTYDSPGTHRAAHCHGRWFTPPSHQPVKWVLPSQLHSGKLGSSPGQWGPSQQCPRGTGKSKARVEPEPSPVSHRCNKALGPRLCPASSWGHAGGGEGAAGDEPDSPS